MGTPKNASHINTVPCNGSLNGPLDGEESCDGIELKTLESKAKIIAREDIHTEPTTKDVETEKAADPSLDEDPPSDTETECHDENDSQETEKKGKKEKEIEEEEEEEEEEKNEEEEEDEEDDEVFEEEKKKEDA